MGGEGARFLANASNEVRSGADGDCEPDTAGLIVAETTSTDRMSLNPAAAKFAALIVTGPTVVERQHISKKRNPIEENS